MDMGQAHTHLCIEASGGDRHWRLSLAQRFTIGSIDPHNATARTQQRNNDGQGIEHIQEAFALPLQSGFRPLALDRITAVPYPFETKYYVADQKGGDPLEQTTLSDCPTPSREFMNQQHPAAIER